MQIIKNLNILNAILKKMAKENTFSIENVYIDKQYKYICTVDHRSPDGSYAKTTYKGSNYQILYFDGCFNPFIVKL